ncbi:hypothetical protein [Sorangium sp. So ce887]|uniref:hypothetical protein n=1 Tax=Sorangium sp. So ce887 TaxID=3133324 RepID=UPI003F648C69
MPGSATDPGADAPLVRWIRATQRHPHEAAIAGGIAAEAGAAIAASHGLVARVDLASGRPHDLHGEKRLSMLPCEVGRTGRDAWVACALGAKPGSRILSLSWRASLETEAQEQFAVHRHPLDDERVAGEPPVAL